MTTPNPGPNNSTADNSGSAASGPKAPRRQSPSPHGASAADLLGPELTLTTQELGHTAALAGEHISTCPWKAPGTELEHALQAMWIRGYAAGRTDLARARTPHQ